MKNPPPPDRFAEVRANTRAPSSGSTPQISIYYFWMNATRPPFDDVRVRRAVNYAIDPAALERIYAGPIAATQQVLPPGMPGHRSFQPYPHDLAKAQATDRRRRPRRPQDHGLDRQPDRPTTKRASTTRGC